MKIYILTFILTCLTFSVYAQNKTFENPANSNRLPDKNLVISGKLETNLANAVRQVSREKRELAYSKILEGQRYWWHALRLLAPRTDQNGESVGATQENVRSGLTLFYKSRAAYLAAVEADPFLAEGYLALAEGFFNISPQNLDESLKLVRLAIKLSPENLSAHQLAARILTMQSQLRENNLNAETASQAIAEWNEIVRLDPLNAEGFAFLSEFYRATGETERQIESLKKWISAESGADPAFYQNLTGNENSLAPDNARVKLASLYLEEGQFDAALVQLVAAIADNPENALAIELINEAVTSADKVAVADALKSFQQTAEANPENSVLAGLLAQMLAKTGNLEAGEKILRQTIARLTGTDKNITAELQILLGDILAENDFDSRAIEVYREALGTKNLNSGSVISDENLDFAIRVYNKIIRLLKNAEDFQAAAAEIEKVRKTFGANDVYADRQLIDLLRETGKRAEALELIQKLRLKNTKDVSLLREEATVLTEIGRVDEAVSLIKKFVNQSITQTEFAFQSPTEIKFSNYLFIAGLYSEAKRGAEAIAAANQAYSLVEDKELRQIARLTLATAQQANGDFSAAEKTLREILQQNPKNPIALNNLGYFLTERGEKLDEALTLIQKAVRIDPTNPSYLDSLGWVYFRKDNFVEAEKYLKLAAKYDSGSATIYQHLGEVYAEQSKNENARSAWRRALNLATDAEQINQLKAKLK